jgi:repressor LexA
MVLKRIGSDEEIVEFILAALNERGYPPTLREIGDHWGVSKTSAEQVIARMERDGLLEVAPNVARGIRVKGAVMSTIRTEER